VRPKLATAARPRSVEPARVASEALDILVIDDNPDVADSLAELLGLLGHHVSVANSGAQGIELILALAPSLVLCDLGLPSLDGVEICRRVRGLELARQPMMVALTGWGRDVDRQHTKEVGFDDHLVKPVSTPRLKSLLERVAASHVKLSRQARR
jgi:CheY-like chemotaxis protein